MLIDPSLPNSGPAYSVMRLALKGTSISFTLLIVWLSVFSAVMVTSVFHSSVCEKLKRLICTPVFPLSVAGIVRLVGSAVFGSQGSPVR